PENCLARLHELLEVPAGATVATILSSACAEISFDGAMLRRAAERLLASSAPSDRQRGECLASWLAAPDERLARLADYVDAYLTVEGSIRQTPFTKKMGRARSAGA